MLDEFDFVALRGIDKSDNTSAACLGGTIGKWITFCRSVFGECLDIVHLERQVRDVLTYIDRTTPVEPADLNFFITARRLEEDQL
jgi:hypothetical protein